MAPTSHVPTSQAPMPYALSHAAENRSSDREFIEPATGFSLLHTIQLGQSANAATSPTAKVAPTYSGCSVASGTAVMTALPPAVATPAAKKTPQTPHVVQHCEQNLRQELGTITRRVFDIIAGRRRVNDLRRINIDPIIHAAILTLSKKHQPQRCRVAILPRQRFSGRQKGRIPG